jgi:hypothetical protein
MPRVLDPEGAHLAALRRLRTSPARASPDGDEVGQAPRAPGAARRCWNAPEQLAGLHSSAPGQEPITQARNVVRRRRRTAAQQRSQLRTPNPLTIAGAWRMTCSLVMTPQTMQAGLEMRRPVTDCQGAFRVLPCCDEVVQHVREGARHRGGVSTAGLTTTALRVMRAALPTRQTGVVPHDSGVPVT